MYTELSPLTDQEANKKYSTSTEKEEEEDGGESESHNEERGKERRILKNEK